MTDLAPVALSEHDARRLTERIRIAAVNYSEAKEKLLGLVQEAKDGAAHLALGYASWTAYLAEVLGEEPLRLARDERREIVQLLAAEGMSVRAISSITDTPKSTVADQLSGVRNRTPEPATPAEVDAHAANPDFLARTDGVAPSFRVSHSVTGLDGKTYARPEPAAPPSMPRPEPVTDQFTSAVADLNRVLSRFHRITEQANYGRNTDTIRTLHQNDLTRAVGELQDIINNL